MRSLKRISLLAILILLISAPGFSQSSDLTTIFLVRHAEKQVIAGISDVPLSESGIDRAKTLAYVLSDVELTAVYSTDFIRTIDTAAPTAKSKGLKIIADNRLLPKTAEVFLGELVTKHRGEKILIVSHSNVVPVHAAILTTLVDNAYDAKFVKNLNDGEYDNIYVITINERNEAVQNIVKFGKFTPNGK